MKSNSLVFALVAASVFSTVALASPPAKGPCDLVEAACVKGGFTKVNPAPGKNLIGDCMRPLLNSAIVPGVKLSPATAKACKTAALAAAAKRQNAAKAPAAAPAPATH